MSDIATPGLAKAEALFKDLVWAPLIQGAMAQFGLNWWPLNTIIGMFTNRIFEGIRLSFDLPAIAFRNDLHRKEFDRAAVTLKIIAEGKGPESPEYKAAKEAAKNALSKFVRYGATL